MQLSKDVSKIDTFMGYESIVLFCIKYNIICKIYWEDDMYKGNKWIEIKNENKEATTQEIIFLSCHQGLHPDLEDHYDTLKLKNKEPTAKLATRKLKKF